MDAKKKILFIFEKNWKKIAFIMVEILFFIVSILRKDFGWLFSLNLTFFWYPLFLLFWNIVFGNLKNIEKSKWPIFVFWGLAKFFIYTAPFFVVFIGNKYISEEIFNLEACLIALGMIIAVALAQIHKI